MSEQEILSERNSAMNRLAIIIGKSVLVFASVLLGCAVAIGFVWGGEMLIGGGLGRLAGVSVMLAIVCVLFAWGATE